MKKKIYVIMLGILIVLCALYAKSNSSIMVVSNTNMVAWGFVRGKNGESPIFTKLYTDILDNNNGIYIGNNEKKYIYLTFDEGYENGYTANILDTLKRKKVTAAFFITSDYLKKNQDLVKRMIDEGHIVGNHTNSHPSLPLLKNQEKVKKEIDILEAQVMEKFNYKMIFFRPPKGEYNESVMQTIKSMGYTTVLWSFAYDDWNVNKQNREEYAKDKILNNIHNGSIMLLHAVSKDNSNILEYVIDCIQEKGYEFKSLNEFEK